MTAKRIKNTAKQKINFTYNSKKYIGFKGDSLAAALIANNVSVVTRSFKYRRKRGVMTSGAEEPNALMQIDLGAKTIPNIKATQIEIYEGLVAKSVNSGKNPNFDLGAIIGLFSKFIPAGFYYKTFMWPKSFWMKYEYFLRKFAGFGKSPKEEDPDFYDHVNYHVDILIVGAGLSGIAAAKSALKSGARVLLVDENPEIGGKSLYQNIKIDGKNSKKYIAQAKKQLDEDKNLKILTYSTAFGYYDHNLVYVNERKEEKLRKEGKKTIQKLARERIWKVRAKKVILATGAIERPIIFENNDKPGVMMADSVLKYLNYYDVLPGENPVIFTNNDSAYNLAFALLENKVNIAGIIDVRNEIDEKIIQKLAGEVKIYKGYALQRANGNKGVSSVTIRKIADDKKLLTGEKIKIKCDLVAVSGGFNPVIHLSSQSGAKAIYNDKKATFLPGKPVQEEVSVGSCKGDYLAQSCFDESFKVGQKIVKDLGFKPARAKEVKIEELNLEGFENYFIVKDNKSYLRSGKQFIDMQGDVTSSDIELAAREGYESIEHVKRYTALGFGTDQGKIGNIIGILILADILGKKPQEVGTTTFRPAYTPVTFGAFAGQNTKELYDPVRKTPIHKWHIENGALFEDVGQWKRAWYYSKKGEKMQDSLNRETLSAHNSAAIMDATTLGKIDIKGPDAAKFLNMVYTNSWLKLGIGKCRYGIMLGEDGMIIDDGVTMRLAEDHYVMTTTTGGAARILQFLEFWLQTKWPNLKVYLTSLTDHYAAMAISGPNSRKIMKKIFKDVDFSKDDFPFMSFKDIEFKGVKLRILRISFTGELSYEIHINANYARSMWDLVMKEGKRFNITPYGTEAMHILRAEKGFIIVGQDTDGTLTPSDANMNWAVGKKKSDFLGMRSLSRPDMIKKGRKQLVGLETENSQDIIEEGSQIVDDKSQDKPLKMHGHVTSSYYSAILKKSIALALIKDGLSREGDFIYAMSQGKEPIKAKIVSAVFYDPKGERQNV